MFQVKSAMLRVFSLFAVVAAVAAADVTSATSVQPAVDLITRNFGKAAAAIFKLALKPEGKGDVVLVCAS